MDARPRRHVGKLRWLGPLAMTAVGGRPETIKRAAVVEFENTAAMEFAANSGFVDFEFAGEDEDTVAIVLHTPK